MKSLRYGFSCCAAFLAVCLTGCGASDGEQGNRTDSRTLSRTERMDRALSTAARYLLDRQAADGAWRSETYGAFKDGSSLTPWVLRALLLLPAEEQRAAACRKG